MAILQAIFTLVTRSAGKILNAIFGWAVHALFGQRSAREQTFLSAVVGAAVAWPLLVVGAIAPKLAAFLVAFIPLPHWVPSWTVRVVWLALAAMVPFGVGVALAAKAPPHSPPEPTIKRVLRGVPVTIGMAAAFTIMFLSVPVMRLVAMARGRSSADVPLMTDAAAYHQVAGRIVDVLRRHGFALQPAPPGWWVAAPIRILNWFGGDAFRAYVPNDLEHFASGNLDLSIYPSGVLLRGRRQSVTWAHGLIAESVVSTDGLQTSDPAAQQIERQIKDAWKLYDRDRAPHADSARLTRRLRDMTRELGSLDVEFDDWQIVYRQLLQLERATDGERQLLDDEADGDVGKGDAEMDDDKGRGSRALDGDEPSTAQTVREIIAQTEQLLRKQIDLAVAELKANARAEGKAVGAMGVGAVAALIGVNLLFTTAILALAVVLPAWLAGLIVTAVVLAAAAGFAVAGWRRRVRQPLAHTRDELRRDARFAKERLT